MTIKLLIFKLAVQSSYQQDEESEASDINFDTLQWWITPEGSWRIRTFVLDEDIHVDRIEGEYPVELAEQASRKHFGDILAQRWLAELDEPLAPDDAGHRIQSITGSGTLQMAPSRQFGFWNPDGRHYSPKSSPE